MSNEVENVVDMNGDNVGTEGIKGTDFVEPQGKVRKIVKWVLGGLAFVATGILGAVIGRATGKDDGENNDESNGSEGNPESNG